MVLYSCEKCNITTDKKTDYEKHIQTKKHQRNVGVMQALKTNQKPTGNQPFRFLTNQKPSENQPDAIFYECDYCDDVFTHINSKYRHQKYRCKAKRLSEDKDRLLAEKDKRIDELIKSLNEAMKQVSAKTSHINNQTNNTNCVTNNSVNITINSYGKEDLSYLTDGDWLKMLKNPDNGIVNLFIETHLNPEHPENSNVRQRNRNSKYLEIKDEEGWKHIHKKKVLSDISDNKRDTLEGKYDELQDGLTEQEKENHSEYYDDTYYDTKREVIEKLEATMLNSK